MRDHICQSDIRILSVLQVLRESKIKRQSEAHDVAHDTIPISSGVHNPVVCSRCRASCVLVARLQARIVLAWQPIYPMEEYTLTKYLCASMSPPFGCTYYPTRTSYNPPPPFIRLPLSLPPHGYILICLCSAQYFIPPPTFHNGLPDGPKLRKQLATIRAGVKSWHVIRSQRRTIRIKKVDSNSLSLSLSLSPRRFLKETFLMLTSKFFFFHPKKGYKPN